MKVYQSLTCENSCDAVLWNNDGDELIVSFYDRLDENNLKGSIVIYEFESKLNINEQKMDALNLKQIVDHGNHGILHICPVNNETIAVADSSGFINLLKKEELGYRMYQTNCEISEKSMCLYMDYNQSNQYLWYSCQNGHIGLTKYDGISGFKTVRTFLDCHQFEAWYVCCYDENIALTGGDDGNVCVLDSRMNHSAKMINKYFTSGVTSIVTVPQLNNYTFLVGSFDESISMWDIRSNMKQPIKEFDKLGGQLWRMRWNTHNSRLIACAMMQSGSAVFEFNQSFSDIKVIDRNQSSAAELVYGIEWHPRINNLMASCSHKDKLLELLVVDLIEN